MSSQTPVQAYINSLDLEQQLALMHELSKRVALALPQSTVPAQIEFYVLALLVLVKREEGRK